MPSVSDSGRSLKTSQLNQINRNALRKCLRSCSWRQALVGFLCGSLSNSSIMSISACMSGAARLHLHRDRMHQRFERSRIVREPGDELARLRRSWNHNFPREPLDRQIGGIEYVAMRVDDAVDPRRHRLRPGRCWEHGFASRQCDAACDKLTPTPGLPRSDASEGYLALPDCPGLLRLRRGTAKRPDTQTGARGSIRIFLEHQVDAAVPGTMKFCQELFGRRDTARDIFLNRAQIACLILAASIQPPTPRKSLLRQHHRRLGEMQHVTPRDPSREA